MAPFFYGGNMKIPVGVTRQNIIDQVEALKETLNEYINHIHNTSHCQLCVVAVEHPFIGIQCGTCPWAWFTNGTCINHCEKKGIGSFAFSSYNMSPAAKNIRRNRKRQIKRWIIKLEKYLEEM